MEKLKRSKPAEPVKLKIKKGDTVEIISGKDKGKRGEILAAYPKENKVKVRGANMIIRHQKDRPSRRPGAAGVNQVQKGGRIEKEAPLFAAKVMLVCPQCGRPTRVGYAFKEGTEKLSRRKFRVCKHPDCGKPIDS
ncbi:MAG TPA: 50S ribosomal protein L24 [Chthonomonadaceae bacterium]|nr:50S ribosomal protein L24 [Chthonomonadaceae bacterium]